MSVSWIIKMDTCRDLVIVVCITNVFFGTVGKWSTCFPHILCLAGSASNEIDHIRGGASYMRENAKLSADLGREKIAFLFEIRVDRTGLGTRKETGNWCSDRS